MEGGGGSGSVKGGSGLGSGPGLGIPGCEEAVEIGRGGFAVVYRARQPQFNRMVAVKVLALRARGEDTRSRFEREIRAMGVLSGHPHIATVYQAGLTAAGNPYIVMELASEGTLANRLQ